MLSIRVENPCPFRMRVASPALPRCAEVAEDDDRGIAHGREMPGEGKASGFAIDAEDGDVVAALVAAIEKAAGGIERKAAGIVSF